MLSVENPYSPPAADLPIPADISPGARWGLGLVGALGTLEGVGLATLILLDAAPADRWSGLNLALVGLVFGVGIILPAWGVGWHLGRRLERGGFWRGLGACLLTSTAWGVGIMALVLLAALGRGVVAGEAATVLPKLLLDREALQIQGIFCLLTGGPTCLGGLLTGGILAWRRRRARRQPA